MRGFIITLSLSRNWKSKLKAVSLLEVIQHELFLDLSATIKVEDFYRFSQNGDSDGL